MTEFHRKIEVQSPEDLQFLLANVRRAANAMIDKDLPPIQGEDPMRSKVEDLVHDYITRVFVTASPNITINGLDPSPSLLSDPTSTATTEGVIEEFEPFNGKNFERLKDLVRQEEDLVEDIAKLRRENPRIVAERAIKEYKEGMEWEDEELKALEGVLRGQVEREELMGIGKLERQEEVERAWARDVTGLENLKRTLPETVALKERAERAEAYITKPEKI